MVYVDDMAAPYGRMVMCHMMADTTAELLDMVAQIGVNKKWIQDRGTYLEHFDISKRKKLMAIKKGARLISSRELVARMHMKRPVEERPEWAFRVLEVDHA